jgi:hypothetical protein
MFCRAIKILQTGFEMFFRTINVIQNAFKMFVRATNAAKTAILHARPISKAPAILGRTAAFGKRKGIVNQRNQ